MMGMKKHINIFALMLLIGVFSFSEALLAAQGYNTTRSNRSTSIDNTSGSYPELEVRVQRIDMAKKPENQTPPAQSKRNTATKPPFVHYKFIKVSPNKSAVKSETNTPAGLNVKTAEQNKRNVKSKGPVFHGAEKYPSSDGVGGATHGQHNR